MKISSATDLARKAELEKGQAMALEDVRRAMEAQRQKNSYIGRIGQFMEPVMAPLGFDWRMSVSLLSGVAAKEIIISTMGILYQADVDSDETSGHLIKNLQEQEHKHGKLAGKKVFSRLVAFGFMLFVLIYFPCVAVIAAIKKESNWKWAVFSMFYTTTIAWIVAFVTYQIGSLFI